MYIGSKKRKGKIEVLKIDLHMHSAHSDGDYGKLKAGYITVTPFEGKVCHKKHVRKLERWFHNKMMKKSKEALYS